MSNEVIALDKKLEIEFTPSKIEIKNEKELTALVDETVKQYGVIVFDPEDIQGARDAHKELNFYIDLLDDKRKEIKKEYSKPLDDFEIKIKKHVSALEKVKEPIKGFMDNFDEKQRDLRKVKVEEKISEIANIRNVNPEEIEVLKNWTNATAFTGKGELKKATVDQILSVINDIYENSQRIENDKRIVEGYARAFKLDVDSWLRWIDNGSTAAEVTKEIDVVVAKRNREEKEVSEPKVTSKNVDIETGEIISEPQLKQQDDSERETLTIKFTGSYEQFSALNQAIISLGIEAEVIE